MTSQPTADPNLNASMNATTMPPQQLIDQLCDKLSVMEHKNEQSTKELIRKKRHWERAYLDLLEGRALHRNAEAEFLRFRSGLISWAQSNAQERIRLDSLGRAMVKAADDLAEDVASRKLHKSRYKTALLSRRRLEVEIETVKAQLKDAEQEAEKARQLELEEAQSSTENADGEATEEQAESDLEESGGEQHTHEEAEPQFEGYYYCQEDDIYRCSDCRHEDINCQCPGKYGDGLSSADSDSLAESEGEYVDWQYQPNGGQN